MNWIFKSQIEKENSIIISGSKTVEPLPSASQKRLHTSVSEVCGWRMSRFLQVDRRELPCERSELSCAKDAIMWAKRAIMRQRRYHSSASELSCAKGAIIRASASYHAPKALSFECQRVIMHQRRYHGSDSALYMHGFAVMIYKGAYAFGDILVLTRYTRQNGWYTSAKGTW